MAAVSVNVSKVELVWYLSVNVGWDVGRYVDTLVDNEVVSEVGSGNDGWAKLMVEDAFYSDNESSVSKYFKM